MTRRRFDDPNQPHDWTHPSAYMDVTPEEQNDGLALLRFRSEFPRLIEKLNAIHVDMHELATRALIGEARPEHWRAMANLLQQPVEALMAVVELCLRRTVVDGDADVTRLEIEGGQSIKNADGDVP